MVCTVIFQCFNPLAAGAAYLRVFIFYYHIKYHFLNMLKIEIVDRVSDTQLRMSENSD